MEISRLAILEILLPAMLHDLNNAMSVIHLESAYNPMLTKKSHYVINVLKELQFYLANTKASTGSMDVHQCIKKCLQLCYPLYKNSVKIKCELVDDLILDMHKEKFQRAMLLLFLNYIHCSTLKNNASMHIGTCLEENIFLIKIKSQHIILDEENVLWGVMRDLIKELKGSINLSRNKLEIIFYISEIIHKN